MFRGGYLGLSWGLPGGFLGVRRGEPLGTPNKFPGKAHRFLFIPKTSVGQFKKVCQNYKSNKK